MKTSSFLIFLSVALTIYGSVNFYIFIRGWQALPKGSMLRVIYGFFFLYLSLSYVVGRVVERFQVCPFSDLCIWTGSFWLGFMLYLTLALVSLDLVRFANHFLHFFPAFVTADYAKTKLAAFYSVLLFASATVAGGYYIALHPVWREITIEVPKKAGSLKKLDIVMASDIHLGTLIKNSRLRYLISQINTRHPDIVLFAGDIIDEDLRPVVENDLGDDLLKIRSKYGIYAINGNHEFIGGADAADRYLTQHGVHMLRDQVALIDNAFYVVGREDRSVDRFSSKPRKELPVLMQGVDPAKPVILMDHQPFKLQEAVDAKVDLQLSGHTHHGQMWPLNFITNRIFLIPYGYGKIGKTSFYVSDGYGTWGPPIRVGNRPEMVHIVLKFMSQQGGNVPYR